MEEILTADQVAKILQVHPFTVLKFIKQGKLKASKLGRVYRIRRSDVDEFLDNQVEKSQKQAEKQREKTPKDQKTPKNKQAEPPHEEKLKPDHYVLELKDKQNGI
ncbi:helix-turn-helix domain-containing protein [Patescibacteria group bacterium]|nr:helix-turn-helix domain-containing protein [Patescibacteria group bacterium]MBU1703374.1 helix-turn-helix domain-containing protein [Patescibacteria group bacterium]MBU1953344.1 helix-turn-helix domain-containing protein [Patescibacteria group bacterium]